MTINISYTILYTVYISAIVITIIMLSMPLTAFASIVDYDDEPEIQEECEERSDYDFLCSGANGAAGIPFCDRYNATQRAEQFPNLTNPSHCLSREHNPIGFCQEFDDLTNTYEYCRNVSGSEEYFEYAKTGGPDESCLFDVYQIKCQSFPNMNETAREQCPEGFGANEDDYCFPLHRQGCPEGYHSTDDDETGQCYPNDEECNAWNLIDGERFEYILVTDREDGRGDNCTEPNDYCPDHPDLPECKEYLEALAEWRAAINQTRTD
jgi:hypothetical protein